MTLREDAKLVDECVPSRVSHISGAVVPDHVFEAAVRLANAVLDADEAVEGGCPWCGAGGARVYDMGTQWSCLSWKMNDGSEVSTGECRDRQIARLTAKLATVSEERDRLSKRDTFNEHYRKDIAESFGLSVDAHLGDIATVAGIRYRKMQSDLADHQQLLMRQSAELNAVRQERNRAIRLVADLMDGVDTHWETTPHGLSLMAVARELLEERKAGCE